MRLIANKGTFKILTSKSNLTKQLLNIECAGRTCYQSFNEPITQKSAQNFINMLIKRGHWSVLEHSCLSVNFKNISRGFTHEMVRHRLASFSQESTRYVDYAKPGDKDVNLSNFQIKVIAPGHKNVNEKISVGKSQISFKEMAQTVEDFYRALRKAGWLPEDARQILPIGLKSEIVVTTNFREWHHIFSLRTALPAHWEIRSVLVKLLKRLKPVCKPIFDNIVIAGKDKNGYEYTKIT